MSSHPRLAYLTALYPAASHTFILREVTALRALGFEITTCAMRRPPVAHLIGPEEQAAEASTFYVIETGRRPLNMLAAIWAALRRPKALLRTLTLAWRTSVPGVKGALKQLAYVAEAMILSRHLLANMTTHIHNHFAGPSASVTMLTSTLSDIPYSYTLHGPTDFYEPLKWHLDEKTARASFVTCISHFARSQGMLFSDPEHWHKLHIIHCGVIPEQYRAAATSSVSDRPGTFLIFVGRLTAVKGVRILLDAFAKARKTRPDLRLTLIGDGDDRAALEAQAAPLGDAVAFLGYQSQTTVAEMLSASDALILPSFAEGLPVVLMEALAAGKPVLCTQVAGVRELVEDGVSGFIVPAGDSTSLAERIGHLADDPEVRDRMGRIGQAKVEVDFNIHIEAARLGSLFTGQHKDQLRPDPFIAAHFVAKHDTTS